jgi:hypothetical protein
VFYDRIQKKMGNAEAPRLLAYVLAHEIAHVLQGVDSHSPTGIMKADWDGGDYFDMSRGRVKFTPSDIRLIRLGLAARKTRSPASKAASHNTTITPIGRRGINMTRERLQQIEDLFHAARERAPGERESLLAAADPEVRREVESLLAQRGDPLFHRPYPARRRSRPPS